MPSEPVKLTATGKVNGWWAGDPTIIMRVSKETKSMSFIPSEKKFYKFRVIEDGVEHNIQIDLRGDRNLVY
jgi:hypothetical protein